MTTAEMTRELEARYAREYQLIREVLEAQDNGEDTDPLEHAITVNAGRIDWLQEQLSQSTAPAAAG